MAVVEPEVVRTNFRSNQAVPEGVSGRESVYSPHMEVYLRQHAGLERRGTGPVRVARVIHRVIRSRSPGLQDPVRLDARMGMLAARLLPERGDPRAGGPGDHGVGPSQRRRGSRLREGEEMNISAHRLGTHPLAVRRWKD